MVNYNKHFITFYLDEELITLQGETQNQPTQAQFRQLRRFQATDAIVELYALQIQTLETPAQHLNFLLSQSLKFQFCCTLTKKYLAYHMVYLPIAPMITAFPYSQIYSTS